MLRRCVWSRNIKNGSSIYIYIYDISSLRVIRDERRKNKSVLCDERLSSIFPLHNIGYKTAGPTDRIRCRMTFTVRASRIVARMHALPVMTVWKKQFWITRRPRYTEFIIGELHAQPKARCDAGPRPLRRRIYAASHSAMSARGVGGGVTFRNWPRSGEDNRLPLCIQHFSVVYCSDDYIRHGLMHVMHFMNLLIIHELFTSILSIKNTMKLLCTLTNTAPLFHRDNSSIHCSTRQFKSQIGAWLHSAIIFKRLYSVIKKDGLNFVRLYFLNYTWYVNDLHNIWKRRS